MVGIPGVGKTTLLSTLVKKLNQQNHSVSVHSFGTIMLQEAQRDGIDNRDQLRKISINDQQKYQKIAAQKLAQITDEVVLIDTHAFISTPSGFYPGLPEPVLKILQPSFFILVIARPEEIYSRRAKDPTRNRDKVSIDIVKKELSIQESIISTCSVLSGAPMKPILNSEGKIEEAADVVIKAIGI